MVARRQEDLTTHRVHSVHPNFIFDQNLPLADSVEYESTIKC